MLSQQRKVFLSNLIYIYIYICSDYFLIILVAKQDKGHISVLIKPLSLNPEALLAACGHSCG